MMLIIVAAVFAALFSRAGFSQLSDSQWAWFSVIMAALASWAVIRPRFGWMASLLFCTAVGNSVYLFMWAFNRYQQVKVYDKLGMVFFAADALAKLALVVLPIAMAMKQRERSKDFGGLLFSGILLGNLAMVVHQFTATGDHCRTANTCGGMLGNPSMNSTLMIAMLPLAMKYVRAPVSWLMFVTAVAAAVVTQSRAAVAMVAVYFLLEAVFRKRWEILAAGAVLIGGLWPVMLMVIRKPLMGSGDRVMMWEFFMRLWLLSPKYKHFGTWRDWWPVEMVDVAGVKFHMVTIATEKWVELYNAVHWIHVPFGAGYGIFGVFARNLQPIFKMRDKFWWWWMHNDWLQLAFETGVVGFSLGVAVYVMACRRFIRKGEKAEAQALLLFGVCMSMNYPLHLALGCVFACWLVLLGLMRDDELDPSAFRPQNRN